MTNDAAFTGRYVINQSRRTQIINPRFHI
jgi:hypothetical protein